MTRDISFITAISVSRRESPFIRTAYLTSAMTPSSIASPRREYEIIIHVTWTDSRGEDRTGIRCEIWGSDSPMDATRRANPDRIRPKGNMTGSFLKESTVKRRVIQARVIIVSKPFDIGIWPDTAQRNPRIAVSQTKTAMAAAAAIYLTARHTLAEYADPAAGISPEAKDQTPEGRAQTRTNRRIFLLRITPRKCCRICCY